MVPFSTILAPITGSPLTSTTFPEIFTACCCFDVISVDKIIFLSKTEYFTSVPSKILSSTLNILLLSTETETTLFRLTCLLLKKKPKPDCFSISFRTFSTVWFCASILISTFCAKLSVACTKLIEQIRNRMNSRIVLGIFFEVSQSEDFTTRNNWMLK